MTASFRAMPGRAVCAVLLLLLPSRPAADHIVSNDNRTPAGHLRNGVLMVSLEARTGIWEPAEDGGPKIKVAAFAEAGRPLQNPGPLLRVPLGTAIHASVTNRLTAPLWIYGMGRTRGYASDSFDIAPGATREITFRPDAPGTFYYSGRTSRGPVFARFGDDSQLNGVIVVDPPGTRPGGDRIFVISAFFTIDSTTRSGIGPDGTIAFNGRTWPHTEPLTATQGDSLHWQFVNVSILEHPLHLHGFYFRVDAKGDGVRDTAYAQVDGRLEVTETLIQGQTLAMSWSPDRSGNWIFHCHFASHIMPGPALEADRRMPPPPPAGQPIVRHAMYPLGRHGNPMHDHMAGLVLGIRVAPRGRMVASTRAERPIRLIIRSRAAVYGEYAGYSYILGGSPAEADSTAMPIPGPTLVLERGEPVAVTIVNRSHEDAAVHWHGIELASFPDGVAGFSGDGATTLPMVAPGDSLTVHFTPPRAGTFMYHSHSNEFQQIGSGLYGAIVVTDRPAARDTSTDRVLLFSDDGPTINFFRPPPPALLNGRPLTDTLALRAGVPQRLRIINIRTDYIMGLTLTSGDQPVLWRPLAKDGADLPASRTAPRPASITLAPGEIADVEVTPAAGPLQLHVGMPTSREDVPVVVPVVAR